MSAMADNPAETTPPFGRRRTTILGIIGRVLLAIVGLIFLAWLILYITKGRFLKHRFERYVSSTIKREVHVAGDFQLYFDPIDIKFLADGMTVANPEWRGGEFLKSRHIELRMATIPLIFGTRRLRMLDLEGTHLDLAWDKAHVRNTFTFDAPDKPGKKFELPEIVRAQVVKTDFDYLDPLLFLKTHINVDTVEAKGTRLPDTIGFDGTGTLRAKPFAMRGRLLSPNATVEGGANRLQLAARGGDSSIEVSGTLPGAFVLEGAKLKLVARGPNLSELVAYLGAVTPRTRAYVATADLTKQGEAWRMTHIHGRFGASDLSGSATFRVPAQRLRIDADLRTQSLDIVDAGPFIGYDPNAIAAGKVAVVKGGHPRLLPDSPLQVDALQRFDANVKYYVGAVRAKNLPASNIDLTLSLDHGLMRLSPLTLDLSGGHIASDISVDARHEPVFTRYDIRLSPTPLGTLLARFGTVQSGTTGTVKARLQMSGTGDSIARSLATSDGRIVFILPQGTFWTRNVQLSELDIGTYVRKLIGKELKEPVAINCGLVGFTVRNGVGAADPILIDTRQNVILGRGGFSFRDETLDFSVRADSKKFSAFSGQSPIGISGYFAQPGIKVVSPQLLARGGAGLGLAALVSPLAGLLAFVDVGDAKGTQCGPVLAGAHAAAQRTLKGDVRNDVGTGTASKDSAPKKRKKFLGIF